MGFSNLIALSIMTTTAATLHVHGVREVATAAQAAEALRPLAGAGAFALFALGIVGTGLLSVPVLAGSAAYALGEARLWPVGLARTAPQAKAFYAAIACATLLGALENIFSLSPIPPVMALNMLISVRSSIMGEFRISRSWTITGWVATGVMGVAAVVFVALSL